MGFISAYVRGNVTAKDLVKIAVDRNRLSSTTLNDHRYINEVDSQLMALRANH
jgi:hypothetical protein